MYSHGMIISLYIFIIYTLIFIPKSARFLNRTYVLLALYSSTGTYNKSIGGTDTVKSMIEGLELMIN